MYPYPGYCGMGRTEFKEIPETDTRKKVLQNFQKFRVLWHGGTELTEVPGRYENAVLVSRVLVALAYRTYRSSGYTGNTPVNTRPQGWSSI